MQPVAVYFEGVELALFLIKPVFTNEDGSTGIQYLVASDTTTMDGNGIAAIYQKRWNVAPYRNYYVIKQPFAWGKNIMIMRLQKMR